ncbi:hypothetical protein CRYUN_Cryun23aG0019000 [Craigia yunnanensis]
MELGGKGGCCLLEVVTGGCEVGGKRLQSQNFDSSAKGKLWESNCAKSKIEINSQKYTSFRVKEGELIKERLDRVLVNLEWMKKFPNMQVINLPTIGSNHSQIVMNTNHNDIKNVRKFKFEASWLTIEECGKIIKGDWDKKVRGSKVNQVVGKLKFYRCLLKE